MWQHREPGGNRGTRVHQQAHGASARPAPSRSSAGIYVAAHQAPGAQTGLSGARQEVCCKRAAALIDEDVFNVKERQCLPRIRELCVCFSSPCVTEMTGLIKPANLQQSKQNHPGAGKLPGALCETCIAHQGISRIALLREKDLRLLWPSTLLKINYMTAPSIQIICGDVIF